ncbi:MAG: AMP-binding protein [Ilumatobacteraceae bacterium]
MESAPNISRVLHAQPLAVETLQASLHRVGRTDPTRTALVEGDRIVTYAELSRRVAETAESWDLLQRSVVVLSGDSCVELIVAYLSLLEARHVPLLAERVDSVIDVWRPAAVVTCRAGEQMHVVPSAREHQHGREQALHPDLALLMTTSGSTGSPKLVRLSSQNLISNAHAIADYLRLTADDRGITSLPMHYCYGLSVLHSHLVSGASLVLTTASVVDPCFRQAVTDHAVTNIAGVPFTFDLLEQSRFSDLNFPSLRFVTQAGGRMAPEMVSRWARRLSEHGAELFVMYGQTEATARMTYLPPSLVATCPGAIGVPVSGGRIRLQRHPAVDEPGVGEIVYEGPNIMMGYAEHPDDLAKGHELRELRTGDLGRLRPEGVYEIVGRVSRFVKLFGLRVDLDHLERTLAHLGVVAVAGNDSALVAAVLCGQLDDSGMNADQLRRTISEQTRLPRRCIHIVDCDVLPRTASGKVDGPALVTMAAAASAHEVAQPASAHHVVAAVFSDVLGRDDVGDHDTFVSLGGDSLNYIECGINLEALGGTLPQDWHTRTVADLEHAMTVSTRSRVPRLDTTVLLRTFSICAIVATHMRLHRFPGGAHLLLAVVGYNFARFQLSISTTRARITSGVRTAARVGLPASAWIGINMLIAGGYSVGALALVNNYTGSPWRREGRWQYWFFEVFVQLLVLSSAILAVPALRRLERRAPFWFPLVLLTPLLAFRFQMWELGDHYNYLFRTHTVAWLFVLGWAVHQATNAWQKLLVSAIAIASVPEFFGRNQREMFVLAGLLLLTWLPAIPLPRPIHRILGVIASASMWIFLVHWQVWPPLDAVLQREVAYLLTILVGIVVGWTISRATSAIGSAVASGEVTRHGVATRTLKFRTRQIELEALASMRSS